MGVSSTLVFEARKKYFEFLQPNQGLKFFKTPRSSPHVDPIEGSKDILGQFDIKISGPRTWNFQPIEPSLGTRARASTKFRPKRLLQSRHLINVFHKISTIPAPGQAMPTMASNNLQIQVPEKLLDLQKPNINLNLPLNNSVGL